MFMSPLYVNITLKNGLNTMNLRDAFSLLKNYFKAPYKS